MKIVSTVDRLQALIDQWRLHPDPEVGSCANQLAGWLRTQEAEKEFARGGNQAVSQHLQSAAAETDGLSATAPEKISAELLQALKDICESAGPSGWAYDSALDVIARPVMTAARATLAKAEASILLLPSVEFPRPTATEAE